MDSALTFDSTPETQLADTSIPVDLIGQEKNERDYFGLICREIYRDYKDSEQDNPIMHIALIIFSGKIPIQGFGLSSTLFEKLKYEIPSFKPVPLISERIDYFEKEKTFITKRFISDSKKRSYIVNWQRASELYKKFIEG